MSLKMSLKITDIHQLASSQRNQSEDVRVQELLLDKYFGFAQTSLYLYVQSSSDGLSFPY